MENVKYLVQVLLVSRPVIITFVAAVCTLIIVYGWIHFYGVPVATPSAQNVVAEPVLTPDEVAVARLELPVVTPAVSSTTETETVATVEYVPEREGESSEASGGEQHAAPPAVELPKEPVFTTTAGGITVGTPVVVSSNAGVAATSRTISGTVVGIDTEERLLTVVGSGAATRVTLEQDARITVDGQRTDLEAVALNDIVTVNGTGVLGSDEMTASTIEITGVFTIAPF